MKKEVLYEAALRENGNREALTSAAKAMDFLDEAIRAVPPGYEDVAKKLEYAREYIDDAVSEMLGE